MLRTLTEVRVLRLSFRNGIRISPDTAKVRRDRRTRRSTLGFLSPQRRAAELEAQGTVERLGTVREQRNYLLQDDKGWGSLFD